MSNTDIKSQVYKRLTREGRWAEAEPIKDRLIREKRATKLFTREEASIATYAELDRLFPALPEPPTSEVVNSEEQTNDNNSQKLVTEEEGDVANRKDQRDEQVVDEVQSSSARMRNESTIRGLGDLPPHWPQLPPNASLSQEVQWVLANRVQVVKETQDGISVDLSKSLTPAPSYATLGWLETSIRAFAKFVDVSTKASASGQDDADKVRAERLAISEIRDLLSQMKAQAASK
jgi:hypothetical protein